MSYKIVVEGYGDMESPFQKLAGGMGFKQIGRFEALHALMFADTQARVHVQTERLKLSGMSNTDFDGDVWSGEIEYLRHPGVFELARGDSPTWNHPEGGHDFFSGLKAFFPQFEQNIQDVFRDAFDKYVGI